MILFTSATVISIILAGLLVYGLFRSLKRNSERRWKKAWQYFLPSLAALAVIIVLLRFILPMSLDLIDLKRDKYKVETHTVEILESSVKLNLDGQEKAYYSGWETDVIEGKTYLIYRMNRTGFCLRFIPLET